MLSRIFTGTSRDFKYRIPLSFYPLIGLSVYGLLYPPELNENFGLKLFCSVIFTLGFILRVWGSSLLTSSIVVDAQAHANHLLDTGAFALIRNPLYSGAGLMLIAILLHLPFPAFAAFMIYSGLIGLRLALYEEKLFSQQFGAAYADYQMRTGRFAPDWLKFSRWRLANLWHFGDLTSAVLSEITFAFYGLSLAAGLTLNDSRVLYGGIVVSSLIGGLIVKRRARQALV